MDLFLVIMANWTSIVLEITTPIIGLLIGILTWFINKLKKTAKEKEQQQNKLKENNELLNYSMGVIDTILNKEVKLQPNFKKELKIISDRYHVMDLNKENK